MKKIEPGCLCLVVGFTNEDTHVGKCVTAVKFAHDGEFDPDLGGHLRTKGRAAWKCSTNNAWIFIEEKNLRRIDDYEPEQTTEQQKEVATC